jgi:hypothetical protein
MNAHITVCEPLEVRLPGQEVEHVPIEERNLDVQPVRQPRQHPTWNLVIRWVIQNNPGHVKIGGELHVESRRLPGVVLERPAYEDARTFGGVTLAVFGDEGYLQKDRSFEREETLEISSFSSLALTRRRVNGDS